MADRSCEERRTGAAKEASNGSAESNQSPVAWEIRRVIHDFMMFYFSENTTDYIDTNASNCI